MPCNPYGKDFIKEYMKPIFLLLFLWCCTTASVAQQSKSALFLGNSYTNSNDLPKLIQDLATSKGNQFTYQRSTPGGYSWDLHSILSGTLTALDAGAYDYLILQEQSTRLADNRFGFARHGHPSFLYADFLDHRSKIIDSCHQTLLYLTWGRRDGNSLYQAPGVYGANFEEMQDHLTENYLQLAELLDAQVAPVGEAWRRAMADHPQINLFASDGSHPSIAGSYLAACVFYAAIFHESPNGGWYPNTLSATVAQQLQGIATQTVVGSWSDWYIDPASGSCFSAGLANNNAQWEQLQLSPSTNLSEIHFTDTQHGHVKADGPAVWQTTDAGDSWQPAALPENRIFSTTTTDGFDITFLHKDTGWLAISGIEIDSTTLHITPFGQDTAEYASFVRIFQTTDGGTNWLEVGPLRQDHEILNSGLLAGRKLFLDLQLHFDNALEGTLLAQYDLNNDTVVHSFWTDDGGLTWQMQQGSLGKSDPKIWMESATKAYKSGYKDFTHGINAPQKLYRSIDRGASWQELGNISYPCCTTSSRFLKHHFSALHSVGEDTLLLANSLSAPIFYRSIDGGASWDSVASFQATGTARTLLYAKQQYYVGIGQQVNRILRSSDHGATWELEAYFPTPLNALAQAGNYLFAAADNGYIHRRILYPLSSDPSVTKDPISFQMYPNPSKGLVQLAQLPSNGRVTISNLLGQTLQEAHADPLGNLTLHLSGLSSGVYFVQVEHAEGVQTQKLWLQY